MPPLDYRSIRLPRKPFPWPILLPALAAPLFTALFYATIIYHDYAYLGPPTWLVWLGHLSLAIAILGVASSMLSLGLIPFRYRSLTHLLTVLAISLLLLIAIPTFHIIADSELRMEYHHPPCMKILSNARTLAQTAFVYAWDQPGTTKHFPPHPAALILTGLISPKQLIDPDLDPCTLPTPLPPESAWPTLAPDVDAHSIFIYTAADLFDPDPALLDPAIILLYTKPCRVLPHHRILVFADATAQLIPDPDLPQFFAANNAARAQLHLPPFTLDGPPPPPLP